MPLIRAARVRTGPADASPSPSAELSECLLVEGSGDGAGDGGDPTAMFDGMVVMQELPMECENPAASGEGGASLYGGLGAGLSLDTSQASAAPPKKAGGLFSKFGKDKTAPAAGGKAAPKAQSFPPEMLAKLGLKTNEDGTELQDAEVEIPPGVTEASIAQCMEMGFTKALSVGWLAVTNNNPEQALEHLLKGELPPSPGDAARPPVAGGPSPWESGGGYPGGGGGGGGAQLPDGWERRRTEDGREFFVDHKTQTTHWQLPGGGGGKRMVTMELTVPPGASGGQLLTVTGPTGKDVSMMLPAGARPGMKVRFQVSVDDTQGAGNTVKLEVVVPMGAWPGQPITVQAPNGEMIQVQVPIGASAGLKIQFDVDARYGRAPEKVTMQVTLPPGSRPGQLLTVAKPNGALQT
eukprot:COSAG04_NODE_1662_length_6018_cov_1.781889_2_plen_408_part_00